MTDIQSPIRLGVTKNMYCLYLYIKDYIHKNQISPSYEEMANYMGLKARSNIHRMVHSLHERGWIVVNSSRPRSIAIIEDVDSIERGQCVVDEDGNKFIYTGQGKIKRAGIME